MSRPMDKRHVLGRAGEELAANHLKKKGYKILASNLVNCIGELDLVALDGETVVIVEVKTRSKFGRAPGEAVNFRKQVKLTMTAELFLANHKWHDKLARFDVVEIIQPDGGAPLIKHIIDAFDPIYDQN